MADRAQPLRLAGWTGIAVAAAIPAIIAATSFAVVLVAEGRWSLGAADVAALRFTIWQAFLSGLISVLLAIPLARAQRGGASRIEAC